MKKRIIFIVISILVCTFLILTIKGMYTAIGGIELGFYLNATFVAIIYTMYTIYYLATKTHINTKEIHFVWFIYGVSILPYFSMWIWELW